MTQAVAPARSIVGLRIGVDPRWNAELVAPCVAAVAHAPTFPSRRSEYGPVLASVLDNGRAVSAVDLHAAQLRRRALREAFRTLFDKVDYYADRQGRELLAREHGETVYADAEKHITELELEANRPSTLAAEEAKHGGCGPNCRTLMSQASSLAGGWRQPAHHAQP